VRLPLLSIPFERDEGEYAYIGWRLGHNEMPYRDWFDQKPPAIFWVYRAALSLPLDPICAVHFVAMLFSAASACALFLLARRFVSQFWAFVAATLFALLSVDPLIEGTAANTELFMLLPLILSQIAFLRWVENPRSVWWIIACGVLNGIAISFKQVALVNWCLLIALSPVFVASKRSWRDLLILYRFAAWAAAGLVGVAGTIAFYFWIRGGLSPLIDNVITHNLEYIGMMTWAYRLWFCLGTLSRLGRTEALVWIFSIFGLVALVLFAKRNWLALLGGWLATSALGVSASGYFFPHYFQQLLPPLALAATCGAQSLSELRVWRSVLVPRVALSVVMVILPLITLWPFWLIYSPADAVRKIYPGNFFAEMPQFAARLAQVTSTEQRVFLFGSEPEVLFYARRVSATRYIIVFPLYGPYRNVREKQMAAAEEIQRVAPSAAVLVPIGLIFWPGSDQYFTEWSSSYFRDNFSPDTWLIRETESAARIVPARPDLPQPHNLLGEIFVRKPSAP
jgi:4-amino-4-deoxy-L-arabinose transferase-like glycosyltransferase